MLLADIGRVIAENKLTSGDWIPSSDLIDHLVMMAERPWGEVNRAKPINERWLSVRLSAFDGDG
jgi:hypothetical protein